MVVRSPLLCELRFMSPIISRAWAGRVRADHKWRRVLIWLHEPTGNPLLRHLLFLLGSICNCLCSKQNQKPTPFYSSSTRESLASNTSSIVESNRRQNPALSPAHGGAGPTFNFRASTDPPTNEAEKLQKPSNCLQASVTSV